LPVDEKAHLRMLVNNWFRGFLCGCLRSFIPTRIIHVATIKLQIISGTANPTLNGKIKSIAGKISSSKS
jgi:hypothetical protein